MICARRVPEASSRQALYLYYLYLLLLEEVLPNILEYSEKYFVLIIKQFLRKTINSIIVLFFLFLMKSVAKVAARALGLCFHQILH